MSVPELGRHTWAELADVLRDSIIGGQLEPGERLVEAELAEKYGVSRGPVRSALAELAHIGLVEGIGRRGVVVVRLTPSDVAEVYELRFALEAAAIARLCAALPAVNLAPLEACLTKMERALRAEHRMDAVNADLEFHRTLCSLAGNRRLLAAWDAISNQVRLMIGTLMAKREPSVDSHIGDHRPIHQAIAQGDAAAAVGHLRAHLDAIRDVLTQEITLAP